MSEEAAHVVVIDVDAEGGAIHDGDDLIDHPALRHRQLVVCRASLILRELLLGHRTVVEIILVPHAVPLDDDTLRVILRLQLREVRLVEVGLLLHADRDGMVLFELRLIVLGLALLAEKKQGCALGLEILLGHGVLDELGLAGLEEAVDQEYRNLIIL